MHAYACTCTYTYWHAALTHVSAKLDPQNIVECLSAKILLATYTILLEVLTGIKFGSWAPISLKHLWTSSSQRPLHTKGNKQKRAMLLQRRLGYIAGSIDGN